MGGSTSKCLLYRADTRAWPAGRTSPRRQTYHPSAPPNLGGMALATPEASAFRGPPSTRPAPPPRPSRHRVRPSTEPGPALTALHALPGHSAPSRPALSRPPRPARPFTLHARPSRPTPRHATPPPALRSPLTAQPARPRHRFHPARSPRPSRPAAHRATGSSPAVSCGTIFNGTNPKARVRKGISRSRAQTKCYQYIRVPCGHVRHAI
jgi:hypothetical protein